MKFLAQNLMKIPCDISVAWEFRSRLSDVHVSKRNTPRRLKYMYFSVRENSTSMVQWSFWYIYSGDLISISMIKKIWFRNIRSEIVTECLLAWFDQLKVEHFRKFKISIGNRIQFILLSVKWVLLSLWPTANIENIYLGSHSGV